ncbi:MAG: MBL fold metallo-hydrolase [Spirulinaceae cyanobacterium]
MSSLKEQFKIQFWGVRGSIPCPGPETVRYGGNTPCLDMVVNGKHLIFDGGTGLRVLGQSLLPQRNLEGYMFFTHSHWDHIQGFPFFVPAFVPGNMFHIHGAVAPNGETVEQRLHNQMLHPNFPVPLRVMQANLKFYDLEVGDKISIGDIVVENGRLNHPGEAIGYRVTWQGKTAAYVSDTEHFPEGLDKNVLHLAHQADVLIIDATYTDEEYYSEKFSKVGWGHSTWQEAVKIAKAAEVKQLVIFHHDPLHNDGFLDEVGKQAAAEFPNTILAREGMSIELMEADFPTVYQPEMSKAEELATKYVKM